MRCYRLSLLLIILNVTITTSQRDFSAGLLPSLNVTKPLPDSYTLNFRLESRQFIYETPSNSTNEFNYEYVLTDLTTILARKIDFNKSIALGYLFRIEENGITHRTIQQFFITQRLETLKLSHRIVTDQTFSKNSETTYRLRYRIATELPLQGTTVDAQEFYFKFNNEYLASFEKSLFDVEIRLVPFLGYEFNGDQKLELGFDYRINSFVNNATSQRLFLSVNFFQTL